MSATHQSPSSAKPQTEKTPARPAASGKQQTAPLQQARRQQPIMISNDSLWEDKHRA